MTNMHLQVRFVVGESFFHASPDDAEARITTGIWPYVSDWGVVSAPRFMTSVEVTMGCSTRAGAGRPCCC